MFRDGFVSFAGLAFGDSQERRRAFNVLVFIISVSSIVGLGQGLPGGKHFSKSSGVEERRLERQSQQSHHHHRHHLSRRIASVMVPVRERETTALCTYEVTTDVDLRRIPDKIDRVLCRKDSCKCAEQGDYRCTQLYTQLNVTYLTTDSKPSLEFELIDVEYACVCSRALEGSTVNLLEPVLVR